MYTIQDFLCELGMNPRTLVYRIEVQAQINVQVKISLKLVEVQTKIKPCRWEFIFKINKRACIFIRYTRVAVTSTHVIKAFFEHRYASDE